MQIEWKAVIIIRQLLCFGDSNTWGLIPKTNQRYPWGVRWPSLLQQKLESYDFRVLEQGLCGRTAVFEDPFRENRKGIAALPQILESCSPLDAAVIMLGTNDCKSCYNADSQTIAQGIGRCVDELLKYLPAEKILIVSPIALGAEIWKQEYDPEFDEQSVITAGKLFTEYKNVASKKGTHVISAADYVKPSQIDLEHLSEAGHKVLADVIFSALVSAKIV